MLPIRRPTVLITGANGGMGRAVARQLGVTMDLILTDIAPDPLGQFSINLLNDGYTVVETAAGDLCNINFLEKLCNLSRKSNNLDAIIHTAGLSPAQSNWRDILRTNIVATQRLMTAIEPIMKPGSVGVLIASMAGYIDPGLADIDKVLDGSLEDEALDAIGSFLFTLSGTDDGAEAIASQLAYVLSKRAVIRLAEQRAIAWGKRKARIVSVSPGLIYTPMGVKEAEANLDTKSTIEVQPVNRWGTAMDVANAIAFLVGPNASFITGCDLRVDGGAGLLAKKRSDLK